MIERFTCPPTLAPHMAKLFGAKLEACENCGMVTTKAGDGGEYDCFAPFSGPPVVVDVGACVGAFARWAQMKWPGAIVHCYEPNPRVQNMLAKNVAMMSPQASITAAAVLPTTVIYDDSSCIPETVTLYAGRDNVGESSLDPAIAGTPEGVDVPVVWADNSLPACDVLKLDCEGNEPALFDRYVTSHEPPLLVLVEYHSPRDATELARLSLRHGYRIVKVAEDMTSRVTASRGVMALRHEPEAFKR